MSKIYMGNDYMIEEALKDFFKAIELGSRHIAIYNGISCAYLQAKKYEKALIYSNICLNNHPHMEEFLVQRSLIYLELEEYKKSIEDLTTALGVNDRNPIIYYRRGLAFYKNKDYEKAIHDL
jgi:tetratricopeptide (TPR) repeat protein